MDLQKFQFKRINPFQGLVIDADTWQDAHNYHRNQQRLHVLAFHKTGIVSGLEVTANDPADMSVNISPGMAIDPEGNVILVSQKQRFRVQTQGKGLIYLTIQFREIPGEPYQPPDGGQPTRIVEAYKVQERNALPSEPYVELARIEFDNSLGVIKDAGHRKNASTNEINLHYRERALTSAAPSSSVHVHEEVILPKDVVNRTHESFTPSETLSVGYLAFGEAGKGLHIRGLKNLLNTWNRKGNIPAMLQDEINLQKPLTNYNLIYLTGSGRFELTPEQLTTLGVFLKSGGIIFGDGCSDTSTGKDLKSSKEFGLAYNRYAGLLNCKLGIIQRSHPILSTEYIFTETPAGCEPGMVLEGGGMIYSGSDYGCAWDGGHPNRPLTREVIRSAFEIGENILSFSRKEN